MLLSEAIDATVDTPIVDDCSDLKVLRQLRAVVVPIEPFREDLVSHLDRLQVHLELLCQLHLGHIAPSFSSVLLPLLQTLLQVKFGTVEGFDLLGVGCHFA